MFTVAAFPPPVIASPTVVQRFSSSSTRNNGAPLTTPFHYVAQYPGHATTSGNALVVAVSFTNNVTPSVIDDATGGSNTYTPIGSTFFDGTSIRIALFGVTNCAAGARNVTVAFSADPGNFVAVVGSEHANVTGFGSSTSAPTSSVSGTNTAVLPLSPSISNQVWMFTRVANNVATAYSSNGTLLGADTYDGHAFSVGSSQMTVQTSGNCFSAGVILNYGIQGSVPSGVRIAGCLHQNVPMATTAGGTGSASPNPGVMQFPCIGSTIIIQCSGGPSSDISSITDNHGNTWAARVSHDRPGVMATSVWDCLPASGFPKLASDLRLTITFGSTNTDITVMAFDVVGTTGKFDQSSAADGFQNSSQFQTPFSAFTPNNSNSVIVANMAVDFNTLATSTGDNQCNSYTGQSQSGPCPTDENNGWLSFVMGSPTSFTVTFTGIYGAAGAFQNWSSVAAVYF